MLPRTSGSQAPASTANLDCNEAPGWELWYITMGNAGFISSTVGPFGIRVGYLARSSTLHVEEGLGVPQDMRTTQGYWFRVYSRV